MSEDDYCPPVVCDDANGFNIYWLLKWHVMRADPDNLRAAAILMMEVLDRTANYLNSVDPDSEEAQICGFSDAVDAFIQHAVSGHYHTTSEHIIPARPAPKPFTEDDLKTFSEMLFGDDDQPEEGK